MSTDLINQLRQMWRRDEESATSPPIPICQPAVLARPASAPNDYLQVRLRAMWARNTVTQVTAPPPTVAPDPAVLPVFVDIETRSTADIRLGGRRYAYHPTTEIVSVVAMLDSSVIVWVPGRADVVDAKDLWPALVTPKLPITIDAGEELPVPLRQAILAGRAFCAHNAHGFDAHVWRAKGLPSPPRWIDTLPLARAAGLPGGLDELSQRLFGIGKDKEGQGLVKAISRPAKNGMLPQISMEQLIGIARYNVLDVVLLAGAYALVSDCEEPEVLAADRAINDRGIAFDVELAKQLVRLERAGAEQLNRDVELATVGQIKGADLRRNEFLRCWLAGRGITLPDLTRQTIEKVLESRNMVPADARTVLEARLFVNRITSSKLETAIAACNAEGRLQDMLVYHGAHTGRWSGRNPQPHNLPRPKPGLDNVNELLPHVGNYSSFVNALAPGIPVADAISALIRPCFCAKPGHVLCIADFAGVEARGVAWCADEQRQLELFAVGGDNYLDLATQIFGYTVTPSHKRERAVGKLAVLGCGYGMGATTFAGNCKKQNVDLAAAHTSAEAVVDAYRDRYPKIAGQKTDQESRRGGLWRDLERAARRAINRMGLTEAGKCQFYREGVDLIVRLPSGRRLFYRNARLEHSWRAIQDRDAGWGSPRSSILFDDPNISGVVTYGGKLTENVVSAICRDLLATAIVACEQEGLPVVLHVHDEIVLEVPIEVAEAALRRLLVIMSSPPCWATGFPIEVEGFSAERYFKTPPSGTKSLRARQGAILQLSR